MTSSEGLAERTVLKACITRSDMLLTDAVAALELRKQAVRAVVVVIAGLVPREAFKGPMLAIGKIYGPPFGLD